MSKDERKSISDEIRSLRNLIISVLVTVILSAAGVIVSGVIFVYNLRDNAVGHAVAISDNEGKHSGGRGNAQVH